MSKNEKKKDSAKKKGLKLTEKIQTGKKLITNVYNKKHSTFAPRTSSVVDYISILKNLGIS